MSSATLITLTQHRVAWLEQIVLRITGTPHLVFNSSYSFCESTGPLPFVQSYDHELKHAHLVGRYNPNGCSYNDDRESFSQEENKSFSEIYTGSDILLYLCVEHGIDLDSEFVATDSSNGHTGRRLVSKLTKSQAIDRLAYMSVIRDELNLILQSIRFCDELSYRTCYIPTSRKMCLNHYGERFDKNGKTERRFLPFFFYPFHLKSVWERMGAISNLKHLRSYWGKVVPTKSGEKMNTHAAISLADEIYTALNDRLCQIKQQQVDSLDPVFLLGIKWPTKVDALMFAHLAEAMSEIRLFPLFSRHDALVTFFRYMFNTYFGPDYRFGSKTVVKLKPNEYLETKDLEELVLNNNCANFMNASGCAIYDSVRSDLASVLKLNVDKESLLISAQRQKITGVETIQRWLLDGGFPSEEKMYVPTFRGKSEAKGRHRDSATQHTSESDGVDTQVVIMNLREERKKDDFLWLSCIAAGVVGILMISRQ